MRRAGHGAADRRARRAGSSGEGWRVRKDGSRFWAMSSSIRSRSDGELLGFAKITRDLTEQRAAQPNALRESERQFRLLVQSVTDYAIYMLDPDGHVPAGTLGAAAHQGLYAATRSSASISPASTPPEDRAAGVPARGWRRRAREGRFETEGWRVRKDGTRFWAHVVIDAIRDDDGAADRLRQDHPRHHRAARSAAAAGAGARGAVPVAEDGGHGPAHRRRCARFQQSADGHHGRPGHNRAKPANRYGPHPPCVGHVPPCRRPGGRPYLPLPGVLSRAGPTTNAKRSQHSGPRHGRRRAITQEHRIAGGVEPLRRTPPRSSTEHLDVADRVGRGRPLLRANGANPLSTD